MRCRLSADGFVCWACRKVAQQSDLFAAVNVVCEQTILYAGHTENVAQQSDLFAAANTVCKQMIPYAEHRGKFAKQSDFFAAVSVVCVHTENFAQQSDLVAAGNPVWEQMDPYAAQAEISIQYPDFVAAYFFIFWTFFDRLSAFSAWQLCTTIFQCCLKFTSPFCQVPSFRVSDTLQSGYQFSTKGLCTKNTQKKPVIWSMLAVTPWRANRKNNDRHNLLCIGIYIYIYLYCTVLYITLHRVLAFWESAREERLRLAP